MAHDRVNVVADDFCFEEGMTKNQIESEIKDSQTYLVPTVEKVQIDSITVLNSTAVKQINTVLNDGTSASVVEGILDTLSDGTIPTITFSSEDGSNVSMNGNLPKFQLIWNNSTSSSYQNNYYLGQLLARKEVNSNNYINMSASSPKILDMVYDLKNIYTFDLKTCIGVAVNGNCSYSTDGVNWTAVTLRSYPSEDTNHITARYVKYSILQNYVSIYYIYFDNIELTIPKYENQFTLADISSFNNNQVVNIKTPATTDLTNVVQNKLNNKLINGILIPNGYYSLIYNSTSFDVLDNKIILDITLTEDVTSIDISGLLESNGIYAICIMGTLSTAGILTLYENTTPLAIVGCLDSTSNVCSGSILFINNNKISCHAPSSINNGGAIATYIYTIATNLDALFIKSPNGYTIKVGTNIQIRRLD